VRPLRYEPRIRSLRRRDSRATGLLRQVPAALSVFADAVLAVPLKVTALRLRDEPLHRRAAVISSRSRAGLYDSLYVALAEREGAKRGWRTIRRSETGTPHRRR
jgi:predicted nucleic acid-binding protein